MTLHLEIRFLTDVYVATSFNDRGQAEWPPHPARVFSALTAALYDGEPHDGEREALAWLASQPPPTVLASDAHRRLTHTTYVPVNDQSALASKLDPCLVSHAEAEAAVGEASTDKERARRDKARDKAWAKVVAVSTSTANDDGKYSTKAEKTASQLLPDSRFKAGRTFPTVVPLSPQVVLRWDDAPPGDLLDHLDSVCSRVARLGHSRSLVAVRATTVAVATDAAVEPYTPHPDGGITLRAPQQGQLAALDAAHALHQQEGPRMLPASFVRYRRGRPTMADSAPTPATVFARAPWLRWRVVARDANSRRLLLDVSMAEAVCRGLKATLLAHGPDGSPTVLTGHSPDGSPAATAHAAFVPIADVGHEWATGTILGVAVQLPRGTSDADIGVLAQAVRTWEMAGPTLLTLGRAGVLHLERTDDQESRAAFTRRTWCAPSRHWATVTPIALDRNPGNLRSRDPDVIAAAVARAEGTIARACKDVGLPRPRSVSIHKRSVHAGCPAAHRFMPFPRTSGHGHKRVCVHAELLFDNPVEGPIMLGAGRYVGVGLCRPVGGGA